MHILFIGGTRFIGLAAVRKLHEMGHDVTVFHRGNTQADLPEGVNSIHGDMYQLEDYREAFAASKPDVAVHNMLISDKDADRFMNVFKGVADRVVGLSSCDVYLAYGRLHGSEPGDPVPTPVSEDGPLRKKRYPYRSQFEDNPDHPMYNYDKIPAEQRLLNDAALPGTVLRLPMVYGPRDYQRRLWSYIKRMDDQRPAIIMDERAAVWRTCMGYVEDVGKAIALAATDERASGRIYNVAEPTDWVLTQREWVQAIADVVGWQGEIVTAPAEQLPEQLHLDTKGQDLTVMTTRIREELGFSEDIPRVEAIRRTVEWDRAHPMDEYPPDPFDYAMEDDILAKLT